MDDATRAALAALLLTQNTLKQLDSLLKVFNMLLPVTDRAMARKMVEERKTELRTARTAASRRK